MQLKIIIAFLSATLAMAAGCQGPEGPAGSLRPVIYPPKGLNKFPEDQVIKKELQVTTQWQTVTFEKPLQINRRGTMGLHFAVDYATYNFTMNDYFSIDPECNEAEDSRIKQAAVDLRKNYDLIVRYEDPDDFFVPPLEAVDKDPKIRIERAEKNHVYAALKGIGSALKMYPPMLVRKYLTAIFIARTLEINGVTGAAMFANSWIYVAVPARDELGIKSYELSLHHELSSLLFYGADFPTLRWHLANETGFQYLDKQDDIIKAADPSNRKDPKLAETWHAAGFVSDYGMASMENDVNTFAELMMGDPDKLRRLCEKYPKIAQKKKILVQFYTKLAPKMSAYFDAAGLTVNSEREPVPPNGTSN